MAGLADGPPGIATQRDADGMVMPLVEASIGCPVVEPSQQAAAAAVTVLWLQAPGVPARKS